MFNSTVLNRWLLVGMLVFGLSLVACGGGNEGEESTAVPDTTTNTDNAGDGSVVDSGPATPTAVAALPDTDSQKTVDVPGTAVLPFANRQDITIPPLNTLADNFPMLCRGTLLETFPIGFTISPNATFTFQATGLINFYGGPQAEGFAPDGDPYGYMASIASYDSVSGYNGPAGALVGLFLDDTPPVGDPSPEALDFLTTSEKSGTDFATLAPGLRQIFFIGDGRTGLASGDNQTFTAPEGATRLFLGFADADSFAGSINCYGDNIGSFRVQVNSSAALNKIQ